MQKLPRNGQYLWTRLEFYMVQDTSGAKFPNQYYDGSAHTGSNLQ